MKDSATRKNKANLLWGGVIDPLVCLSKVIQITREILIVIHFKKIKLLGLATTALPFENESFAVRTNILTLRGAAIQQ